MAETPNELDERIRNEFNTFELVKIPLGSLTVDEDYQRGLKSIARHIADDPDPRRFGTVIVNQRTGGEYFVIDGSQRVRGFRMAGISSNLLVPCEVHRLSVNDEALLFTQKNFERVKIERSDHFKSDVFRGDPEAIAVKAILDRYGIEVRSDTRTSDENDLRAIHAVRTIYAGMGGERLDQAIGFLKASFPLGGKERWNGILISGAAMFFEQYERGGLDKEELIRKTSEYRIAGVPISAPRALMLRANEILTEKFLGVSTRRQENAVAATLVEIYNTGRTGSTLPEWGTDGRKFGRRREE